VTAALLVVSGFLLGANLFFLPLAENPVSVVAHILATVFRVFAILMLAYP
jgi:hypothetical protein